MGPHMEETRCDRLALLVAHAHQMISAGHVGRGLDLLTWASEQRQLHCMARRRAGHK